MIYDRLGESILEYTDDGMFRNKFNIGLIFDSFKCIGSTRVIAYSRYCINPTLGDNFNSSIFTFNYSGDLKATTFVRFPNELSLFQKVLGTLDNISYSSGVAYIYDYYLNEIFAFRNDSIMRSWALDFGRHKIPAEFWKDSDFDALLSGINAGKYAGGLENFRIIGNWIVGVFTYKDGFDGFIYNFISKEYIPINSIKVNDLVDSFPKNVGFPPLIIPPFHSDNKKLLISVIEPFAFRDLFVNEKLKSLAPECIDPNEPLSNPVLQLIRLK